MVEVCRRAFTKYDTKNSNLKNFKKLIDFKLSSSPSRKTDFLKTSSVYLKVKQDLKIN